MKEIDIIRTARTNFPISVDPRFPRPVHVFGHFAVCSVFSTIYDMASGKRLFELGKNFNGYSWQNDAAAFVSKKDSVDTKIITLLTKIYEEYSDFAQMPQPNKNLVIEKDYRLLVGSEIDGFVLVFDNRTIVKGKWRDGITPILERMVDEAAVFKSVAKKSAEDRLLAVANIELK